MKRIIWKKSTHKEIYQKNFSDFRNISAIFCHIINDGDFFVDEENISRDDWKKTSIETLVKNAKISRIYHKTFTFSSILECYNFLQKQKFQRQSIYIITNNSPLEYQEKLQKISRMNEILWILPYHPFEKNPHSRLLFEGYIFPNSSFERYMQTLENQEKHYKKFLNSLKIPIIITETSVPIEKTLSYFFKYHYE